MSLPHTPKESSPRTRSGLSLSRAPSLKGQSAWPSEHEPCLLDAATVRPLNLARRRQQDLDHALPAAHNMKGTAPALAEFPPGLAAMGNARERPLRACAGRGARRVISRSRGRWLPHQATAPTACTETESLLG